MPKSISIVGPPGKPGQVYYNLHVNDTPKPEPSGSELLISMHAAALNHRDLFLRQHLYPGVTFAPVPLGADGCGVVVACGPDADPSLWHGKRVIINPGIGWKDAPEGPEEEYGGNYCTLGGTKFYSKGTLGEFLVIDQSEVELAPEHLSDIEAAAFPLTGLTAWRCVAEKLGPRNTGAGKDVLVTGIGGGVALMALGFLVKMGTRVWVSSGSQEKIDRAVKETGAAGGVNYKEQGWENTLLDMVKDKTGGKKKTLDGIIDGAGGDIVDKSKKLLKMGGVIVTYGMTLSPKMPWLMQAVMKNIELKGSTMGSRKEFKDMVAFVAAKKLYPVVSRIVTGIDNLEGLESLFEDMKHGKQFGKLVIKISKDGSQVVDSKL